MKISCTTPTGRHPRWLPKGGCVTNPGWTSSGHGRVKLTECCARCGVTRVTDYGGTNPLNSLRQTQVSFDR